MAKNKEEIQKVVDELELAVMSDKVDMSRFDNHYMPVHLETYIWGLAELERRDLTLNEVFEQIDDSIIDSEFMNTSLDTITTVVLEELYKVWADYDAIVAREDNVLNWVNDPADWKIGYQKTLADLIAIHGLMVQLVPSHYGWVDYDLDYKRHENPVPDWPAAIFNVREDRWSEFNGTFCTDDDSHSGMIADVLYSSGLSRKVRYEGSIGEIMKNLEI